MNIDLRLRNEIEDQKQPPAPSLLRALPRKAFAAARRIALVGNFAPRKCGIATFTTDIFDKLGEFHPEIAVDVHALDDPRQPLEYPGAAGTIVNDDPVSYRLAALRINDSGVDAVRLQHEYGIFGGADGEAAGL